MTLPSFKLANPDGATRTDRSGEERGYLDESDSKGERVVMTSRHESGTETISRDDTRLKEPSLFRVILLNDDYTTMDFVVAILETVFKKSPAEAVQIMLQVHQRGQGVCGVFPKQIAEAKAALVHDRAQREGHPLRCTLEEA